MGTPPPTPLSYGPARGARWSWKAVASLACGALAWLPPVAVAGIVLGHMARGEIMEKNLRGAGLALGGLFLGYIGLMTVTVLLLIGVVELPAWLRPKAEVREDAALEAVRSLRSALYTYAERYAQAPARLAALGPPAEGTEASAEAAGLVAAELATGAAHGYVFTYEPADADGDGRFDSFVLRGAPADTWRTDLRHFYTDTQGILRVEIGRPAGPGSPSVP